MNREMKTARLVKRVPWLFSDAYVYELSEPFRVVDEFDDKPLGETRFVVVHVASGEAMAWACDADGEFTLGESANDRTFVSVADGGGPGAAVEAIGYSVVDEGSVQ